MYFFALDRTYLKSLGEKINRKDLRSIERWCVLNHLQIYEDSSGKFVNSLDFDLAYDKPLIMNLQKKFGNAWYDYYQAYNKDELLKMLDFGTEAKNVKSSYVPKGKFAERINKKSV